MAVRKGIDLRSFSRFVTEIEARADETNPECLGNWAVEELSTVLGFDAAWFGWAHVDQLGPRIHASSSINMPDDYIKFWQTISEYDLLAKGLHTKPGRTATYDRQSGAQNDGMTTLSDRYGLNKIATGMNRRSDNMPAFYISSYRSGKQATDFLESEQDYLQCAVDQLGRVMDNMTNKHSLDWLQGTISILTTSAGIGVVGLPDLQEQLGYLWPNWNHEILPKTLRELIARPGTHHLIEENIVVTSGPAPKASDMGLKLLTIRKMTPIDSLTTREKQVARLLAAGRNYREVATALGVAPATARNHIQAIYDKTEISSRAELALLVFPSLSPNQM